MRRVLLWFFLLVGSAAFAAGTQIRIDGKTYYLHTGTSEGTCTTREIAGGLEIVCKDGESVAALSTADGCLDSSGTGYCARGREWQSGGAGSELTCADCKGYFLWVGPRADCRIRDGVKTCEAPDNVTSATASCRTGCMETHGAATCCIADTEGCPPVEDDTP